MPEAVLKATSQSAPRPAHQASELQSLNLNLNKLKQQGFLVDSNERSQTHEEFRFVKRRVLKTAFGPLKDTLPNANLVLLTSALSNEGKTHTALNLALSIAMEPEKTVLLVDADVLSPSICHTLGVRAGVGLIDYLLGKTSTLQEIIYNTNIPNLRIMPAGGKHHLTSELLASERMANLASELAERYSDRVIIFDAPPLLGINETQALTSLVGQQLVVVEENKTPLHSLESAISLLNADRAIGLVLNKSVQTKNLYAGYGYQYAENQ
ncbi:XrtA-associated tyrosine autokinase [Motilimonas eburnea]|nr:XrtA-associated tyrosine autokinase [Motilimonas eburnea]